MFALFSVAFSSLFIAVGIAAVVGHVLLIDLLLHPTVGAIQVAPATVQVQPRIQPALDTQHPLPANG